MKKVYQKPKIRRVKLIAEEEVLTGCKTSGDRAGRDCSSPGCVGTTIQNT